MLCHSCFLTRDDFELPKDNFTINIVAFSWIRLNSCKIHFCRGFTQCFKMYNSKVFEGILFDLVNVKNSKSYVLFAARASNVGKQRNLQHQHQDLLSQRWKIVQIARTVCWSPLVQLSALFPRVDNYCLLSAIEKQGISLVNYSKL